MKTVPNGTSFRVVKPVTFDPSVARDRCGIVSGDAPCGAAYVVRIALHGKQVSVCEHHVSEYIRFDLA